MNRYSSQDRLIHFLYETYIGRIILKPFVQPWFSELGGKVLNHPVSSVVVGPFIKRNHIDMMQYEERRYRSFNDFFTRKIKAGARTPEENREKMISPCDSKLTVIPVLQDTTFRIKGVSYTLESLLRDFRLADKYKGGYLFLFRLSVEDYHHYCYVEDGDVSAVRRIKGVFHTVNPLAAAKEPIYRENTREYCLLKTERFGTILAMEVGAMLVGKISNISGVKHVKRGQEKGMFEFGGSTIILLTQKGKIQPDPDILERSQKGFETTVLQGQSITL